MVVVAPQFMKRPASSSSGAASVSKSQVQKKASGEKRRKSGRLKNTADEVLEDTITDVETEGGETKSNRFMQCTRCKAHLHETCFDPEKLLHWKKHNHK